MPLYLFLYGCVSVFVCEPKRAAASVYVLFRSVSMSLNAGLFTINRCLVTRDITARPLNA